MGYGEDTNHFSFLLQEDSKLSCNVKLTYIRTILTVQQGFQKNRQNIDAAASKGIKIGETTI